MFIMTVLMKLDSICFRVTGNNGKDWCWCINKDEGLNSVALKQPLFLSLLCSKAAETYLD